MSETLNLEKMLPGLTSQVQAELSKRAVDSFQYMAIDAIQDAAKQYIADAIVPAAMEELKAQEAELRAIFVAAVKGAIESSAQNIVDQTKKKMAGYEGDKLLRDIMRVLMGGY